MTKTKTKTRLLSAFTKIGAAGDGVCFFLARTFAQISQFTIFIIAARVLSPGEFGLFALLSAIAILLTKVGEAGWREFIMTSSNSASVDQCLTAALVSGVIVTVLCLGVAGVLNALGSDLQTAWLLALFALWLLPVAISSAYTGMMVRRAKIAALSFVQILGEMTGLVVSISLLLDGSGLSALIFGRLASQLVILLCLVGCTRWFPPLRLEQAVARELFEFSRHILATRLISFFRSYGATLAIGSFLGAASIGYFRAAERLVMSLSEILAETVQVMAWRNFKRAIASVSDKGSLHRRLPEEAQFLHPILLATASPIFVGLALVSGNLIEVILGEQWRPAAPVVSMIAVRQLLLMPGFITEPLLATAGEVRRIPPVAAFNALLAITLVVACASFGIVAVALGQCFAAAISLGMSIYLQRRYAGVDFFDILVRARTVPPSLAAMTVAVLAVESTAFDSGYSLALTLFLQVAAGAFAYGVSVLILQRLTSQPRRLLARSVPA